MKNLQHQKLIRIRKIVFTTTLFYIIQNYAIGQIDSIPQWIQKVYASKSENLDSFRTEIFKQKNKDISIYQFKNYTDSIFKQDSSLPTMIKTIYVLNVIFKNMDTTLLKQIDYETKYYYCYLMEKMYLFIGAKDFPMYKEDYNAVYTTNYLFPRIMDKDRRTIDLIYKYFRIRPEWIGEQQLRAFRYDSTYQYNNLILKYILKSPDSVDFSKYKTVADESDFMNSMPWEAIYTLAWFDDIRIAPYLEKLGKTIGLRINTTFYKILLTYQDLDINKKQKYDISLRLRLWFIKGILQNKEIFQTIRIIDMFSTGIEIVPFDFYIIGNGIYGFFSMQYKDDYNKLKTIKSRDEQYKYVENFIEKKLKELKKEKK